MSWICYFFRMLFGLPNPSDAELLKMVDQVGEPDESVEQIIDDLRTEWGVADRD
jgi:hypothetical protein